MPSQDYELKNQICVKLNIISQIRANQKIDTNFMCVVNSDITSSFKRSLYTFFGYRGYSRYDLYNLISQLADMSIALIKKYKTSTNAVDISICHDLRDTLIRACNNINIGIRETYITDQSFVSRLEQLSASIRERINLIDNPDYETSEYLA